MIVPTYWAEAQLQQRIKNKQVTVRRFGWSDASQEDAQTQANARAQTALERILAGDKLPSREPKMPYNGAEGVPIREEIVSRHGDTIVTRNTYGALCLNTPDVLFVDIDFEESPSYVLGCSVMLVLFVVAVGLGLYLHSYVYGVAAVCCALPLGFLLAQGIHRLMCFLAGGAEAIALKRVKQFSERHPDWHLRLYRTPAGLRVLVLHGVFAPNDPAVTECFEALGTDPMYARMCRNQQCFRARVSPKPWRIGIGAHLKPRPGVWPVAPDRLPERTKWIEEYDRAAQQFAACRKVDDFGSLTIHSKAAEVLALHDELCRARSALPIA